ncbi:homocysteine S-methyltransferase family protein [Novosphingobium album (ex Hu et al. 2023)]|uniref:Homocysteine S-methyltransferase family protein n=1 Tax=Novosphingobium album (ex Hu et al. 2023) TaxID=2930093 RepID=A0ABT0B5N3_9SPHN|nr:homocysteine S-methyltransferase family protein [Novosphingobium album (ex Hu et al. 2023)]MCJ2180382.1 homocysteine S-methyltransferase family protein [Novosphingobium album (ex Hu et al. 2023)]
MAAAMLPQLDRPFLTDAGLETDILFNRGIDLPHFASITLLQTDEGRQALEDYFSGFMELARRMDTGLILESATWRASPDWAEPLGLSPEELDALNREAISLLICLRENASAAYPIIISGCIGPRGDGYDPGRIMKPEEAEAYHFHQARVLVDAGADMLSAITMTNVPEAIGLARTARKLGASVAISFTVETDGRLPTGDELRDAIAAVDESTEAYPAYYMINCAHPTHFASSLDEGAAWTARVRGVRANASRCSHAELDAMTELDKGDPVELAELHRQLQEAFPQIKILGGCCGTDLRHVTAIAESCLSY